MMNTRKDLQEEIEGFAAMYEYFTLLIRLPVRLAFVILGNTNDCQGEKQVAAYQPPVGNVLI